MRTSLSVAVSVLLGCLAFGTSATDYKLYYLGGQSNMEGYGYVEELPAELRVKNNKVVIFTGLAAFDDDPRAGVGIWEALQPGHGMGFRTNGKSNQLSNRYGPELTFGHKIAALNPGARIAIVKYSLSGSGLADGVGYGNWHPDYKGGTGINQYDHALRTLRNALAHRDIDGDGVADRLIPSGIVWMQGEADAEHSQEAADAYEANLERLMNLLRAALRVDDLPVAIGKITDSGMTADGVLMDYIGTVQSAQESFADHDACASLVTVTDDIRHSADAWHYDSEGYLRLGEAFAVAINELEETCAPAD